MSNSRQSCSSESSTQSDVPSQCQLSGIHRPVPQRNCPNSHPVHSYSFIQLRCVISSLLSFPLFKQEEMSKFLSTLELFIEAHGKGRQEIFPLMKHAVNSIDKPWRQACQPFPPGGYTASTALSMSLLLMLAQSGICRDKVPPLYLPWRLPGEIDSGSTVQR